MPLIKPVIRNGIIVVGLASTLFFAHTAQAVWNGQPYTPGSTLNPECSPAQINCTVAPYTLQNITDQGYTTNRPIRVNGVSTTANILPTSNNLYDLGDVSNYWHRLFANNVSSTNIDALGYVSTTALWVNGSPVTSNVPTLQQVTDQGYLTNHSIGFAGASSTGNIIPTANGLFDLGSSSSIWKKIFAKNASSTALDVLTYVSTTNLYALGNVGIGTGSPTVQLTQKTTAVNESAPLGAEMTDATGWTSTDWTGDYNAGFTHTTGNTTPLSRTMTTTINQTYQVSFTVTGRTAGTFTVSIGGVTGDELFYYSNSFGPRATSTNGSLIFTPTSNFNGTISNISVKLVTGSYGASYSILDNTGAANFEIRSSESSLENHYLGVGAGGYNTTGFGNTANGVQALSRNTSGYYNSANGSYTLASNRSGRYNTAEGVFSLYSNTTGVGNTAIGGESMPSNTSGAYNSSLGLRSLYNNSTGYNNTADGTFALYANTTGYYNSALGSWALYANTSGYHNTALGLDSLSNITTGYDNIGIGYKAGRYIADGETDNQTSVNSIYIGSNTRPLANGNTNEIVIGTTAIGIGSNSVVLGDNNITKTALKGNVGIGTTNPYLFKLTVAGSVAPSTTNSYDLGGTANYWRKLFVNNVSSTNIDADGYISAAKLLINGTEVVTANPNLQQVTDQGATTNKWIRFAGATSTGSINPSITNLYDLGSNTNAWRGIYASTSLNVGSSSFKVDQNGAAIGDGTINNKLSINQLNSNNALLKLSSSALTPGLSYAAAIDFYSNYPGTTNTFNFSKIYTRSDCGLWICGRLTLSVRDNNGDIMDGLTLKGSSNEAAKINIGIGTNNPYLYRLTVDGTVAPSTTNSYDLGSAEHSWRNIYATSTIYSSNSQGTGNLLFATSGAMYANATDINSAAFIFQNKSSGAGALFAIADNLNNYPLLINNDNNTFFGWTPSISGSNRVIIAGNGNRADGDLGFAATSTDNSTFYRWSIGVDKSDGGKFKISSSTALGTNDRLTIDGNGNVGIGTSNPSNFKLQIAGNIGPDANLTYDLGSSANRWKDLYVSSTHIGTSTWDLWQADTGFTISKGLENQYITVSNNGNLGIGTTIPDQGRVEVKGDTVCVDTNNDGNASSCITSESDARLKKNTLEIDGALNKIMQLTGVTYDWKTDDPEVLKHYPLISRFKGHEHTVGLIAQDVQKIFPEALSLETVGDKDVQYYQLDYTKFTPLIIEAIKEQQDQINSLKESQALFTNSSPLGPMQPVIESQAGQAKFLLSQDVIPVIFKMAFNDIPVVTVTPMDKIEGPYWIEKVSATGFEIHLAFAQPKDVIFNWQALYNNNQSFPDYINPPPDYTPPPPIQDPNPTNVTTTDPTPITTITSPTSSEPVDNSNTTPQDQATSTSN